MLYIINSSLLNDISTIFKELGSKLLIFLMSLKNSRVCFQYLFVLWSLFYIRTLIKNERNLFIICTIEEYEKYVLFEKKI